MPRRMAFRVTYICACCCFGLCFSGVNIFFSCSFMSLSHKRKHIWHSSAKHASVLSWTCHSCMWHANVCCFTDIQWMNRRGDNPLLFRYCGIVAFMWVGLLLHINFMFVVLFKKWWILASISAVPACNVCFNQVFYAAANVRNRFVRPFPFCAVNQIDVRLSAWNVRLVWVAGTARSGCVWFLFCTMSERGCTCSSEVCKQQVLLGIA